MPNFLNKLNNINLKTKLDRNETYTFWIRPINGNDTLLNYIISNNIYGFKDIVKSVSIIKNNFKNYIIICLFLIEEQR